LGVNNRRLAEFLSSQDVKFEVIENWKDANELVGRLDGFDLIFRTPGLPYLSVAIQQAKGCGAEISSQTKLFFELCKAKIIGVTGTKGKGTTSSLITKILEAGGYKVWLGGNIGRDPFEFLEQISPSDIVVLELSSFQLQDLAQSPHIAVVLAITPDHLNHHKDFEEYIRAKSQILAHQTNEDFAILHPDLPDWFKKLGKGKKIFFDSNQFADVPRKLLGLHNLQNIVAASEVAKLLNVNADIIRKTVAEFEALPHRLKVLKHINGITYVDDTFSTSIESTLAALDAIVGNLVLIVGGSDKGLDFTRLGEHIKNSKKIQGIVVIGDVTELIVKSLQGFNGRILTGAKNISEILAQAQNMSSSGDTILFSPATASFGIFKNEMDRGEQFVGFVNKL